jgi:hypothetical protein
LNHGQNPYRSSDLKDKKGKLMKALLLAAGMILTTLSAQAGSRTDVSCGELRYMNSVRIELDLKQMTYRVLRTLTPDGNDKLIGAGEVAANPTQDDVSTIYRLIENSQVVGWLMAVDQNVEPGQSFLKYGRNSAGFNVLCVIR